ATGARMLRAGLEPATFRLRGDNGNVSGPQQMGRRGRGMRSGCGLEPRRGCRSSARVHQITEPLRPATEANPPGLEPGPARLELAVLPLHHGLEGGRPAKPGGLCWSASSSDALGKRTARLERGSPEGRAGARPTALHPRETHARLESNQRPLPSRDSAHPLSYGRKEPPAGIEPTPRPYEGRVLAVDTTEAGLPGGDRDAAPLLGCYVAHRLRELPAVAREI